MVAASEAASPILLLFRDPIAEQAERDRAARRTERLAREARSSGRRARIDSEAEPEAGPSAALPPAHSIPNERVVTPDKAFFLALRDELDELMVAYFLEARAKG